MLHHNNCSNLFSAKLWAKKPFLRWCFLFNRHWRQGVSRSSRGRVCLIWSIWDFCFTSESCRVHWMEGSEACGGRSFCPEQSVWCRCAHCLWACVPREAAFVALGQFWDLRLLLYIGIVWRWLKWRKCRMQRPPNNTYGVFVCMGVKMCVCMRACCR